MQKNAVRKIKAMLQFLNVDVPTVLFQFVRLTGYRFISVF